VAAVVLTGWRTLLAVLLLAGLAACGRGGPPWNLKDISGLLPELAFTLTDANTGRVVHAADFRGQVVLLYFGYTHCPDVCPTTLSRLNRALATLGQRAPEVRILFVSVDPKRDTVAGLRTYAQAFGPHVAGLRGAPEDLAALVKRYRISYGYGEPNARGDYEVSHSSAVYIFDRKGQARLLALPGDGVESIGKDLARLVAEQ
jgi:protein SCO1/2